MLMGLSNALRRFTRLCRLIFPIAPSVSFLSLFVLCLPLNAQDVGSQVDRPVEGNTIAVGQKRYGRVSVIGHQSWLAHPTKVDASLRTLAAECPEGWRHPNREDVAILMAYLTKSEQESLLREKLSFSGKERFFMTREKVFPKKIGGGANDSWKFYGYDLTEKKMAEVNTFAVSHEWYNFKKHEIATRCILDQEAITTDPGLSKGLSRTFLTNLPNLTRSDWSFGDGSEQTGLKVHHTYRQPGSYAVTLAISSDLGDFEFQIDVTVAESIHNNRAALEQFYNIVEGRLYRRNGIQYGTPVFLGHQVWLGFAVSTTKSIKSLSAECPPDGGHPI